MFTYFIEKVRQGMMRELGYLLIGLVLFGVYGLVSFVVDAVWAVGYLIRVVF